MRENHNILDPTHDRFFGQSNFYNFVEMSQNNWQKTDTHWERMLQRRSQIIDHPKPLNNTKIYDSDEMEHAELHNSYEW
ncbi:MAG: hypothetical protein WD267_13975 [Balneolales bacterium]